MNAPGSGGAPAAARAFGRAVAILISGVTLIVDGAVLVEHMRTVQWLRANGDTEFRLIEPLIFLPLLGLAGAAWLLRKRHE